jgi:AraC-like DNA-binding protein
VIFDAAALDWPVRDRDPDYAKILTPLLAEAVANAEGDFVSAVKPVLRARIGAGSLTRDSVCRALGLNARRLARRLDAFGVTFSGLADEVRFDAAQSLLLKDWRVGEVAAALGFAEPSAFIRAFKSWSGTTSARWRAARNGCPR